MSRTNSIIGGRRRSPPASSSFEQPRDKTSSTHPFLDVEMSTQDGEASKGLLNEWVPGVSSTGKSYQSSDSYVPSTLPPILTHTPEKSSFIPTEKPRRRPYILGLIVLGFLGVAFIGYQWTRGPKAAAKLTALGEGEFREDFVSTKGTQFMLDCRPFVVAGFNAHDLVPKVLATTTEHKMHENREGKDLVVEMLRTAASYGLNVVRVYAHSTDEDHPFLKRPGEYNVDVLEALDFVMDSAREVGLKVMLSFADNWKFLGGIDQLLEWSSTVPRRTQARPEEKKGDFDDQDLEVSVKEYEVSRHSLFFNDTGAKRIYKNYLKTIIQRENSINGRLYSEDPTLMSWGLLNEPRCETWREPLCLKTFQAWIQEMATYVKSLDGTHLLTIGSEGFYGPGSKFESSNPQTWGSQIGQEFKTNHLPSAIDYTTIHYWPENWNRSDRQYQEEWINTHITVAKALKKPLVLEEFGKKLKEEDPMKMKRLISGKRDPLFESTYQIVEGALKRGSALAGSLFWRWDLIIYEDQPRADYGIRLEDSTFSYIKPHAAFVSNFQASTPSDASCKLQCWVPKEGSKRCENSPTVCQAQLKSKKKAGQKVTYPTQTACCRPGLGAFAEGCSK